LIANAPVGKIEERESTHGCEDAGDHGEDRNTNRKHTLQFYHRNPADRVFRSCILY